MQFAEFQSLAQNFLTLLFQDMQRRKVEIPTAWPIDHLCYRVESLQRYEELKKDFSQFADMLIENDVNGRPIATYKLKCPLVYSGYKIDVVELPAPKAGKRVLEGFEHIEIVCDVPFADLEKRFAHLKLDKAGLKKEINPELEIVLGERNLKFHHQSLESVIAMEIASLKDV